MISNFIENAVLIAKFQALESGLKVVLVKHQLDQDKKNNVLNKTYSLNQVDDLSYGILLKRYVKISKNKELYDRLLVLKDYRNYLAHKSFLTNSSMPQQMKEFIGVHLSKPLDYQSLNQEIDECILLFCKDHKSNLSQ